MITRRDFGRAAAVYTMAQGAPLPATTGDGLRFGFIGIGIRGMFLLEEFQKLGVQPVIAADVYEGHLTRAKEVTGGKIQTTRDYRRVIDNKDLDVIVIATPDHWHKQMALDALSAGKHVYLEKPMAWSIEQNIEIVKAVEKSKKLLQTGSGGGSSALSLKAREIVKSGALGKVNMVRMANHRNTPEGAWVYAVPPDASPQTIDWDRFIGPSPKKAFDPNVFFRWRCWWEYSGGVATDLFVHMLTQLHSVMDAPAPKSVVSQGGVYRWKDGRTVPDVLNSVYEYPGEFVADLYVNLGNSSGTRGMVIMGSEGTLELTMRGMTQYEEPKSSDVQRYATNSWPEKMRKEFYLSKGFTEEGRPRVAPVRAAKPKEISVERGTSHQAQFLLAVREGKPILEDHWRGHAAAGAAHLANQAYRAGRRMGWDWRSGKTQEG
ncbi:MAG: Gfo/Idh/MocA family oxidoreductase [Candidatus Solibacter usitatus]|nr:Gfo/Idh/MocA family oxidoreductase [Candidatus Solibacter usitatus]